MNFTEIFSAFILGVAFSAPPGVITIEAIRRGLRGGFWPAMKVGLGSLLGDALYAILALKGLLLFSEHSNFTLFLSLAGSGILLYLAWDALHIKLNESDIKAKKRLNLGDFSTGALLSLTNPWAIAFWLGFGGLFISSNPQSTSNNIYAFLFIFLFGSILWFAVLSYFIAFGKKYINEKFFKIISNITAFIFYATALYTLFNLIKS